MNEQSVHQECIDKGLTASRVTPADVDDAIAIEHYINPPNGSTIVRHAVGIEPYQTHLRLLTICVLVLRNGFTVTGESACVSPENFDAELGRKIAKDNARAKIWPLLGYALKDRLSKG